MTVMNMPSALRLPPHSTEAEQSLIGGLLLDNLAWDKIADIVAEADFYRDDHRRIFRHVAGLIEAGRPADVVTVFESLEKRNESEQAGGLAYLGEIANNTPSAANIRRYAEIVRERAVLREISRVASELGDLALSPGAQQVDDLLDHAEAALYELRPTGKRGEMVTLRTALSRVTERMQNACEGEVVRSCILYGVEGLDKITRGMRPGELIILAARPSVGKSALALNITIKVGAVAPVLFVSLEMTADANAERALSIASGIPLELLQGDGPGSLKAADWDSITAGLGKLYELPITFRDATMMTMPLLATTARRMRRHGLGLVVVDYLQLLNSTERRQNRTEAVSDISRRLKTMAMDLGVPVLALSQLNRAADGERPTLAHLRESGSIEQDADVVLLLHEQEGKPIELIVAKNRAGPRGSVWVRFDKERASFSETDEPLPDMPPPTGFMRRRGFPD